MKGRAIQKPNNYSFTLRSHIFKLAPSNLSSACFCLQVFHRKIFLSLRSTLTRWGVTWLRVKSQRRQLYVKEQPAVLFLSSTDVFAVKPTIPSSIYSGKKRIELDLGNWLRVLLLFRVILIAERAHWAVRLELMKPAHTKSWRKSLPGWSLSVRALIPQWY